MHERFGLTLVVNHACNLRCTYCYTGEKLRRPMPRRVGLHAIDRAVRSIDRGGTLELAFFGGEPLVEAEMILDYIAYASRQAGLRDISLSLSMTTNGTFESPAAWEVMLHPELHLAVSHDGLPEVHDAYRVTAEQQPTSSRVERMISRLLDAGKEFRAVMVVQPTTAERLPEGIAFLYDRGVRAFDPSLNLWTEWTRADGLRLKSAIARAAEFWVEQLPLISVSWFDEKAARVNRIPMSETSRCGFGHAEIAVTPLGNLYPCERLVGADEPGNAMRLAGHIFDGDDFLNREANGPIECNTCAPCLLRPMCNTATCRCSNYVRTGDVNRPDGLLCILDQTCTEETVRVLKSRAISLS